MCYLPAEPECFGMYFLPLQQQTALDTTAPAENYLSLVRLRQFTADVRCPLTPRSIQSMDDALGTLGGARLLLMIFAWVRNEMYGHNDQ